MWSASQQFCLLKGTFTRLYYYNVPFLTHLLSHSTLLTASKYWIKLRLFRIRFGHTFRHKFCFEWEKTDSKHVHSLYGTDIREGLNTVVNLVLSVKFTEWTLVESLVSQTQRFGLSPDFVALNLHGWLWTKSFLNTKMTSFVKTLDFDSCFGFIYDPTYDISRE